MEKLKIANEVLGRLINHGYEAYIVGGFVRDQLLGIKSDDIDIASSATPDEVMNLFKKHIPTGIKHGTVTVRYKAQSFEVTTFREESEYIDHRKPGRVEYIKDFKGDLLRRDFTINALAMDIDGQIIDYVKGKEDLVNGLIRAVGESADARFSEDALRMLRAFRFSSRLGFEIEPGTFNAIKNNAQLLTNISQERIFKELNGILDGKYSPKAFRGMIETDLISYIPYLKTGILKIIEQNEKPRNLIELVSLSLIIEGFSLLEELKLSNKIKTISKVAAEMHMVKIDVANPIYLFRNGLDACLITNRLNVILNQSQNHENKIIETYKQLPIKNICDLSFKGDDIIALYNRKPGAWIGEILDDISYKVLMRELKNDHEEIKNYLLSK